MKSLITSIKLTVLWPSKKEKKLCRCIISWLIVNVVQLLFNLLINACVCAWSQGSFLTCDCRCELALKCFNHWRKWTWRCLSLLIHAPFGKMCTKLLSLELIETVFKSRKYAILYFRWLRSSFSIFMQHLLWFLLKVCRMFNVLFHD